MTNIYTYRVIKEDPVTGQQGKRTKLCTNRRVPLDIHGLYSGLGHSFPGFWRVLELVEVETV